jgi:hypothetical protein
MSSFSLMEDWDCVEKVGEVILGSSWGFWSLEEGERVFCVWQHVPAPMFACVGYTADRASPSNAEALPGSYGVIGLVMSFWISA